MKSGLFSLTFRGLSITTRFIFLFWIAKNEDPSVLGVFGLFNSSVVYLVFLLGFDFFNYSARLIIKSAEKRTIVFNQLVFFIGAYGVLLPLSYLLFFYEFLDYEYLIVFYAVLIPYHLTQECNRFLTLFKRPVLSNFLFFISNSAWILVFLICHWIGLIEFDLLTAFLFWAVAGLISLMIASYRLFIILDNSDYRLDWKWIAKGTRVSSVLFAKILALKGIEYLDRYFLKIYNGDEGVGVYTFFLNISNLIQTFVFTGIVAIQTPLIMELFYSQDQNYKKRLLQMQKNSMIITSVLMLVLSIAIYPLVIQLNNEAYLDNITTFFILLFSNFSIVLTIFPNQMMYLNKKDILVAVIHLFGFVLVFILNSILVPKYGLNGAALSTLLIYTIMLLSKYGLMKRVI